MILPTVLLSLASEIIFEPSPPQAARNALAIAVQVDQTTPLNQRFQSKILTMQMQRRVW
jgi:hypothetical protein